MVPTLRSIAVAIVCSLVAGTALCQAQHNAPAPSDLQRAAQSPAPASRVHPNLATTAYPKYLWPKVAGVATVYYVNANAGATDAADMAANANIAAAVGIFNADFKGVIQWVPWATGDPTYYVEINLDAGNYSGQCEAIEGFQNVAAQPMTGSAACVVGTILHEMGHIIGLYHEFQRPDRDYYVTLNYNNVIKGSWGNFEILTDNIQTLGLYDYASIMQYPPYVLTRNGGPVIETIPAGIPLGNAEGVPGSEPVDYSAGDKEAIERLYGAPPTQVTVTSNPVGLQVLVDGNPNPVITPQVFNWALNSTHTLSVADGVQTVSSTIEGSSAPAMFYYTYGRWNDSTAQTHTITVLPGDGGADFPSSSPQVATYSANFIQLVPYQDTVYPDGSGTVAISPTPQSYGEMSGQFLVARQLATLTASANSGYNFYQFNNGPYWLPGGLGANPKTFYVPDSGNPIDMTTYFSNMPVYKVDITPETFSSNLSVYVDGDFFDTPVNFTAAYYAPGQSSITWTPGSQHTLAFNSPEYPFSINSRYAFQSWSDGGAASHSIASLPATSTTYIATVQPQFAPATNFSYPPCGGTATLSPASPTNDGFYPSGQVLTYSATSEPGYSWNFAGWSYDLSGTTNPAQLTATDETLVFANFNISTPQQILTLTAVSPSSAIAGNSALNVTLTGTGFSSGSVIGINNGTTTTYPSFTYVSPEELTTQIPASFINTPGAFQLYVENFPQNESYNGCADFGYQTFTVHAANLATSTVVSSSASSATYGSSVTLTATITSQESNATGTVTFKSGSTVLGSAAVTGAGAATYSTTALPYGSDSVTAVYSGDSNNAASISGVLTETVSGTPATLASPAPGGTFAGPSVTFAWSAAFAANGYFLHLGTAVGSTNLLNSAEYSSTTTSVTISALPVNGEMIYARLFTDFGGVHVYHDYTFTASAQAGLSLPGTSGTLAGPTVTFAWSAATGSGVKGYFLHLGTTAVGSDNLLNSAEYPTTTTSVSVNNLPVTGATIYARVYTDYSGTHLYKDYTFTASAQAGLTLPGTSGTLAGPDLTFAWSAATGSNVKGYFLHLGTTAAGSDNLLNSAEYPATTTSVTLTGLPVNGETIYARMFTDYNGVHLYKDYIFTASTQAALTSPTQGTVLPGPTVTFTWSPATGSIKGYFLHLGTTSPGSLNLLNSPEYSTSTTSVTVNNLPVNGGTIYARMFTDYNGVHLYQDYTFTSGPAPSYVGFVYTLNSNLNPNGTGNISAYSEGRGTGALALLSTSPYNTELNAPVAMAVDPAMGFVFAAGTSSGSQSSGLIAALAINESTGGLSAPVFTTPANWPTYMVVGPYGKFLFVSSHQSDSVTVYSVAANGALAQVGSPYNIPGFNCGAFCIPSADQMVYDPVAQTLYVDSDNGWFVATFTVNPATGALTYIYNEETYYGPSGMAVNPAGSFLYVDAGAGKAVNAYTVTTTAMSGDVPEPITTIAGQPFTAGGTPLGAVVEPTGHYLYVTNNGDNNISAYSINQSSGILSQLADSPFAISGGSTDPQQAAVDQAGQYLYVVSEVYNGVGGITQYSINSGTGVLTQLTSTPVSPGTNASYPFGIGVYPLP